MLFKRLTRRLFVKGAAGATAGGWLSLSWLGAGGVLVAAKTAHGAMSSLSESEATTLLHLARTIYPHAQLDDKPYLKIVEGIDRDMAGSADLARSIKEGLAKLDQAAKGKFSGLAEAEKASMAESIASTEFFGTIKGKALGLLYNNKEVWPVLGYEGSSWEKGGYLNRGFNDLDWLK